MLLQGLIAAPFTPFVSERIQSERIPAYAGFLKAQGVSGDFVNGTPGRLIADLGRTDADGSGQERALDRRLALHFGKW